MRERILEAAMRLFLAESFEKTTMRRIAEEIEYSPAAIYSYFKDKDEILFELHQRGFQKLLAMMHEARGIADPVERLRVLGATYLRFALENQASYDLMFISSVTGRKIAEAAEWPPGLQAYDVLRTTVAECIAQRRLAGTDVEASAFALWSACHGMASLAIRQRCVMIPEMALPKVIEQAYELTWRAFTLPAEKPRS